MSDEDACVIVVTGASEAGGVSAQIIRGPDLHAMVGSLDDLRLQAAMNAHLYPDHKYTICRLVPVEDATRIH